MRGKGFVSGYSGGRIKKEAKNHLFSIVSKISRKMWTTRFGRKRDLGLCEKLNTLIPFLLTGGNLFIRFVLPSLKYWNEGDGESCGD